MDIFLSIPHLWRHHESWLCGAMCSNSQECSHLKQQRLFKYLLPLHWHLIQNRDTKSFSDRSTCPISLPVRIWDSCCSLLPAIPMWYIMGENTQGEVYLFYSILSYKLKEMERWVPLWAAEPQCMLYDIDPYTYWPTEQWAAPCAMKFQMVINRELEL